MKRNPKKTSKQHAFCMKNNKFLENFKSTDVMVDKYEYIKRSQDSMSKVGNPPLKFEVGNPLYGPRLYGILATPLFNSSR